MHLTMHAQFKSTVDTYTFAGAKLPFIQYVVSLAIVEAIHEVANVSDYGCSSSLS